MPNYLDVALPVPLRDTFTYSYPSQESTPPIGARVRVKFGERELIGIVIGLLAEPSIPKHKIKDIIELIDTSAFITQELLGLCRWGANYYHHPVGEAISAALPQKFREGNQPTEKWVYTHTTEGKGLPKDALSRAKKQNEIHQFLLEHKTLSLEVSKAHKFSSAALKSLKEKGLVALTPAEPKKEKALDLLREPSLQLNEEQKSVFDNIVYHQYGCFLLEGTTGSGKTELYLQIVARVLQSGRQALILIPEIGLSAQTISRFQKRFNVNIAELHSGVAEGERASAWNDAKSGEAGIIIGTRLASLTPTKSLGVIIIDEEHDRSYKQQDGFKYSARDVSIYRAHSLNIPIVLGSATPSLESLHNANTKKYTKLMLTKRAGVATTPKIEIVDLRGKNTIAGLTDEAIQAIESTIQRGEQSLIFINRRGFAPALICHHCGWSADCHYCDARMTLHKQANHLRCHYCDRSRKIPATCPTCSSDQLKTSGAGTEQIEENLAGRFSGTEIIRVDRDSTRNKNSFQKKLAQGSEKKACIFVGTQMLAKGHHLPNLTLVVVLDADQGLLSPDFRALEQMGQLITQVAGRSGRGSKPGRVLVQSHRPDHPLLIMLLEKGYAMFAETLLSQRKSAKLPPFTHNATFRAESKRVEICMSFLKQVRAIVQQLSHHSPVALVGPHPANIEKINDRFRFTLELTCTSRPVLQKVLSESLKEIDQLALSKRTRWSLDVDAIDV